MIPILVYTKPNGWFIISKALFFLDYFQIARKIFCLLFMIVVTIEYTAILMQYKGYLVMQFEPITIQITDIPLQI